MANKSALNIGKTCLELPFSESMNLDVTYNQFHLTNKLIGRLYSIGTKATLSCKDPTALLIGPEEVYCSDNGPCWHVFRDRQCGKLFQKINILVDLTFFSFTRMIIKISKDLLF